MTGGAVGMRLPDFLIVGVMKGGTTSLARYLGEHPQIYLAPQKEVHFFDRHYGRGLEWYAEHFCPQFDAHAVGEATPNYLYSQDAVERLAATVPGARLVVLLREPVARAYSHYWHERSRGRERLPFPDALAKEPERLRSADPEVRAHFSYLDQGRYARQLERLSTYFPRERVLVLLSEEMYRDPGTAVAEVCRFLEVDQVIPQNVGRPYNRHVSFRSLHVRKVAQRLSRGGALGTFMGRVVGRLNTRRRAYPPMSRGIRGRLHREFESDNQRLAEWLGRDLDVWDR